MNARCPPGRDDPVHSELDQQIPELEGIEQVGIENNDGPLLASLLDPQSVLA
jgi:hypothetical protein